MAAEAQAEVQALLRFLTHDAKVPLAVALPKYNLLRKQGLCNADTIAKSNLPILKSIFNDDKITKQVHAAAKRLINPKKRAATDEILSSPTKQVKVEKSDLEADLALPCTHLSIDEIRSATIETNRAPLLLAFAFVLAGYTLPNQPLSSRLSLAQAVTSAGARSKAKSIGIANSTVEDEGWAQGQPSIKLMGRNVAVMRRHFVIESDATNKDSAPTASHEAFWGIDLEALQRSNGPLVAGQAASFGGPPIHKAQPAKSYLLKSIDLCVDDLVDIKEELDSSPTRKKKSIAATKADRKEKAVAMLLKTIDHVCQSWSSTLSKDELDRRASSWYIKVRPEVNDGQSGWGQRGTVRLQAIIDLAKEP